MAKKSSKKISSRKKGNVQPLGKTAAEPMKRKGAQVKRVSKRAGKASRSGFTLDNRRNATCKVLIHVNQGIKGEKVVVTQTNPAVGKWEGFLGDSFPPANKAFEVVLTCKIPAVRTIGPGDIIEVDITVSNDPTPPTDPAVLIP